MEHIPNSLLHIQLHNSKYYIITFETKYSSHYPPMEEEKGMFNMSGIKTYRIIHRHQSINKLKDELPRYFPFIAYVVFYLFL